MKRFLAAFLLLALPLAASAQTVQYYSYFNGAEMRDLFNFIAAVMGGDDYLGLVKAIAIAGLLVVSLGALARLRGEDLGGFFIAFAIVTAGGLTAKTTVVVNDIPRAATYNVANVPLLIGFFAGELSHIGYWLTTVYEQNITLPDDAKYSENGMVFASRAYDELQRVRIQNATLMQDFSGFTKDCITPELIDRPLELQNLAQSGNIWALVGAAGWLNPARVTFFSNGPTNPVPCDTAYGVLTNAINAEVTRQAGFIGRMLNPDRFRGSADAAVQAQVLASLPVVEGIFGMTARTGQDAIRQSLVMNGLRESNEQTIQTLLKIQPGSIGASMSMVSMVGSYSAAYLIAEQQLPRLRTLVEGLLIGVFPVLLLILIVAGMAGGRALRMYFGALLWVQLWAPMFAIVNYFVTARAADSAQAAARAAQLNGVEVLPTMVNQLKLMAMSQADVATAGMLALWVPAIALALAMGSVFAATAAVSSMMQMAAGSAARIGGEAALGNVSGGNVSWGNFSAGNVQTGGYARALSYSSPDMATLATAGGSITRDVGAGPTAGMTTGMQLPPANLGLGLTASSVWRRSAENFSSDAASAYQGAMAAFGGTARGGTDTNVGGRWENGFLQSYANAIGANFQSRDESSASVGTRGQQQQTLENRSGAATETRKSVGAEGSAGVGVPGVSPVRAGGALSAAAVRSMVDNDIATVTGQNSGATTQEKQAAWGRLAAAKADFEGRTGEGSSQKGYEDFKGFLQRGAEASDKAEAASRKSVEAGTRNTDGSSVGTGMELQLNHAAMKVAEGLAGGAQPALQKLLGSDQGFKQQVAAQTLNDFLASPAGQAMTSSLPTPTTQGSVQQQGQGWIDGNKQQGQAAVNQAGSAGIAAGRANAPSDPRGQADIAPAVNAYSEVSGNASQNLAAAQQQTDRTAAATKAVETLVDLKAMSLNSGTSTGAVASQIEQMSQTNPRAAQILDRISSGQATFGEYKELQNIFQSTPVVPNRQQQEAAPAPASNGSSGFIDSGR